jgi:hypothetical protein
MNVIMKAALVGCSLIAAASVSAQESSNPQSPAEHDKADVANSSPDHGVLFQPQSVASQGSVTVEGRHIDYKAVAGTLIVHPEGWDDAAWREHANGLGDKKGDDDTKAEASMFYVAYFKNGAPSVARSLSSTMADRARRACGCTWARLARAA